MKRYLPPTALVAVFCALSAVFFDRPVALFFKAHVDGLVQSFFKAVTHLGEAQYYLVSSGVLTLILVALSFRAAAPQARDRWRRLAWSPGFMFLSMAISGLIGNALKVSMGRLRPRYFLDENLYGVSPFNHVWGMNSFPSGHSQAAFAAMTSLMVLFPRYAALWLSIAVLVAASRVVTTVHWLSDAVAGSYLGIIVTLMLVRALRQRGIEPRVGG